MFEMSHECIKKHLEMYKDEKKRLETFTNWVFTENDKCSASRLAEAGFYFVGNKQDIDSVQCFSCLKALDGWESDDDPWVEHRNHSAKCKFAQIGKPTNELTVMELIDIMYDVTRNLLDKIKDARYKKYDRYSDMVSELVN